MIRQYDTVKDKKGNRYRVVEVLTDEHANLRAKLKGVNIDGSSKRGLPRTVSVKELERDYERINMEPVKVSNVDQLAKEAIENMTKEYSKVGIDPKDQVIDAIGRSTFGEKGKNHPCTEAENARLTKRIQEVKRDYQKLVGNLENEVTEKNKMISTLQNSVKELKNLCAELGDEKAELAKKIEQQDKAADPSVLRELDGAKAANRALMSELEERDDELRALRKKYEIAEHKIMGMVELVRAVMEGRRMP